MPVRGVIFDLDGTLVDSALDFDAMRSEMGFPPGQPILESIERLDDPRRRESCLAILARHENDGAQRSALMPGARELLVELDSRGIPAAVLTRNSGETTRKVLARLGLAFSHVVTRDDAPPKPDPTGLLAICRVWSVAPAETLFVGDFQFDLLAGRAAGIPTVLYSPARRPPWAGLADYVVSQLAEVGQIVRLLDRQSPH